MLGTAIRKNLLEILKTRISGDYLDTVQDLSKIRQLSRFFLYIWITENADHLPTELKSFIPFTRASKKSPIIRIWAKPRKNPKSPDPS